MFDGSLSCDLRLDDGDVSTSAHEQFDKEEYGGAGVPEDQVIVETSADDIHNETEDLKLFVAARVDLDEIAVDAKDAQLDLLD